MPTDIVIPAALPRPLAEQHAYDGVDAALTVPKDQGELRRLPRYPAVPQRLALAWRFTQDQFDVFWDWYEDELLAGARRFDVFVGKQGEAVTAGIAPGTWHTAQFLEVPQYEPQRGGRYLVRARVLCIGAPFDVRIAPSIFASGVNARTGGARMQPPGLHAAGSNTRDGSAYTRPQLAFFPGGTNGRDGGWFTGLVSGAEDELALVWMGLAFTAAAVEADDAAHAAEWMHLADL